MPFLIALQFLTTLPVAGSTDLDPERQGASLEWYGVVGLVIGVILAVVGWLLSLFLSPIIVAALLLLGWVWITGALHLDGLGDCADACLAPSRGRAFEIMKDPRAGPLAVTAIVAVLIVKFAALTVIVMEGHWLLLITAPIFGRIAAQVLFITTPYVRSDGIGSAIAEHHDRERVLALVAVMTLVVMFLAGLGQWWLLPVLAVVFYVVRRLMMRKLLGTTGDSAGGLIEIMEMSALALLA